jgi:hypothetical protein
VENPSIEARLIKPLSTPSESFQSLMGKMTKLLQIFNAPSNPGSGSEQSDSQSCLICFDDVVNDDSVLCGEGHSICAECFESYLEAEFTKEITSLYKTKGKIICPYPTCNSIYNSLQIVGCGEHIAAQWLKIFHRMGELEGVNSIRAAHSDAFRDLRNRIHDALNLSCPKFGKVFLDYDGCDAVTCSVCSQPFCGLCLKACQNSSEAHNHASACGQKSGYYSNDDIKKSMHSKVKSKQIQNILASITIEEKTWVIENFRTLFNKEGIEFV